MNGTGTSSVPVAEGGSFLNMPINELFSTPPTTLTPTQGTTADLEVNGSTVNIISSSTVGFPTINIAFAFNQPTGTVLTSNTGSLDLIFSDGVLNDDLSCIPVIWQSLGAIICNPVIGDIVVTPTSTCGTGDTYTANVVVNNWQQAVLAGSNMDLIQNGVVIATQTPNQFFTFQAVFNGVTLSSSSTQLTAKFTNFSCDNTVDLTSIIPVDCPAPPPPPDMIPTMSQWALVILAMLMSIMALVYIKRRESVIG